VQPEELLLRLRAFFRSFQMKFAGFQRKSWWVDVVLLSMVAFSITGLILAFLR
jgi:hypothetical protein